MLGDLNCDLLRPDYQDCDGRALLDICDIYDLHCLVEGPTRISNNTATLIDVILVNNRRRFFHTDSIDVHLSDHNMVCTAMKCQIPKASPRFVTYRRMKGIDSKSLQKDLGVVPFHVAHIFDDIDDVYWAWQTMYMDVINEYAPLRKVKVKGNQAPSFSEVLRKAIRKRKRLWRKYLKYNTEEAHIAYKQQRNLTVKLRRKAIAAYFRSSTDNADSDPRKFWKTLKPFLHTKSSRSTEDIVLRENGKIIKDRQQIACIMNNYFVNACAPIAEQNSDMLLNHPSVKSIKTFMTIKNTNTEGYTFSFSEVNHRTVSDIIAACKTSKAPGFDNISVSLLKLTSEVIIQPLTDLINACIRIGNIPIDWKSGQLTPILKKGQDPGTPERGGTGGALPPCPFSRGQRGAKVPFYKVYFINVYMWTEPYHPSIVNHLLSTICNEIVTTAYRFLISAL